MKNKGSDLHRIQKSMLKILAAETLLLCAQLMRLPRPETGQRLVGYQGAARRGRWNHGRRTANGVAAHAPISSPTHPSRTVVCAVMAQSWQRIRINTEAKAKFRRCSLGDKIACRTGNFGVNG